MSNRMWENTVEHAKTCVLGGKLYVYYTDESHNTGVVFNHIYEFRGLIANGQFLSLESLNNDQKISADILVKTAYENWHKVVEYDGKVLNCLPMAKKETKSFQETRMAAVRTTTQNQEMQQLNHSRQTVHSHQTANNFASVSQTIEYPFVPPSSNQLPALPCNVQDYTSMASSTVSGSYNAGDWFRARSGQGLEDVFAEEIRLRSSEMLESDDMQRLLKTFGISMNTVGESPSGFGHTDESCYGYSMPYESRIDDVYGRERGRGSGKGVVGWLKLKAALRWGIFIRKKAAERRPQLVEID